MHIDPTNLFVIWFGGGFVLLLIWAALVGQLLMGNRLAGVRPAIGALAGLGILHPVAAFSAVDLVRLCGELASPPIGDAAADPSALRERAAALALPSWAGFGASACAATSIVVAIALFIEAGGLP